MDAFWVAHLNVWVFLPGNQGFIRATKFTALVGRLLKQGQPGFFFNFEHWVIFYKLLLLLLLLSLLLLLLRNQYYKKVENSSQSVWILAKSLPARANKQITSTLLTPHMNFNVTIQLSTGSCKETAENILSSKYDSRNQTFNPCNISWMFQPLS